MWQKKRKMKEDEYEIRKWEKKNNKVTGTGGTVELRLDVCRLRQKQLCLPHCEIKKKSYEV